MLSDVFSAFPCSWSDPHPGEAGQERVYPVGGWWRSHWCRWWCWGENLQIFHFRVNMEAVKVNHRSQYGPPCHSCHVRFSSLIIDNLFIWNHIFFFQTFGLPYECDSVMHYGYKDFAAIGRWAENINEIKNRIKVITDFCPGHSLGFSQLWPLLMILVSK